jgi:hypothetical protein
MATISKLNNVLCVNISKIDNLLKSNVKYFDDNTFCPQTTPTPTKTQTPTPTSTPPSVTQKNTETPTQTPTQTPTPTPTPPCETNCCQIQLVRSTVDCTDACDPIYIPERYYITKCISDGCKLSNAIEIYIDNFSGKCEIIAPDGYYSDGIDCGYWDSTILTFTNLGPC